MPSLQAERLAVDDPLKLRLHANGYQLVFGLLVFTVLLLCFLSDRFRDPEEKFVDDDTMTLDAILSMRWRSSVPASTGV